jgi:hypothetical protein
MWSKLDDALIDHRKIFAAGRLIGKNGPAVALGFYTVGILWANKHLSDGFLPKAVIEGFGHVDRPLSVADALAKVDLFERVTGGFKIHDFGEYNPLASVIKKKRKDDRIRKQRNGHGG